MLLQREPHIDLSVFVRVCIVYSTVGCCGVVVHIRIHMNERKFCLNIYVPTNGLVIGRWRKNNASDMDGKLTSVTSSYLMRSTRVPTCAEPAPNLKRYQDSWHDVE